MQLAFPADKAPRGRLQAAPSTAAPVVLLVLDNPSAVVALQVPTRSEARPVHVCASADVRRAAAEWREARRWAYAKHAGEGGLLVQLVVRAPAVVDTRAPTALAAAADDVCLSRRGVCGAPTLELPLLTAHATELWLEDNRMRCTSLRWI